MRTEVEVDLYEFSDQEIIEYAQDNLNMVLLSERDLEPYDTEDLIDELDSRGYYSVETGKLSLREQLVLERFFELLGSDIVELEKRLK